MGVEPKTLPTLSCPSLRPVSFALQLLLLGQAQDSEEVTVKSGRAVLYLRLGGHQSPVKCWLKCWAPGLPPTTIYLRCPV